MFHDLSHVIIIKLHEFCQLSFALNTSSEMIENINYINLIIDLALFPAQIGRDDIDK